MVSVTQVLSIISNYNSVPAGVMAEAARIGTETHRYALAEMLGYALDPPDDIAIFVEKVRRWHELHVQEVLHVEPEVIHRDFGYIGHVDMICVLKLEKKPCIVDLKRVAAVQPTTALQLAAYQEAAQKTFKEKYHRRFALHVPKEGECKAVEFKNQNDFPAFLNCLSLYNHLRKGEKLWK